MLKSDYNISTNYASGTCRIWSDLVGVGRIWSDSVGFCRILSGSFWEGTLKNRIFVIYPPTTIKHGRVFIIVDQT